MFTDAEVQKLTKNVNNRFHNADTEFESCNLISTSGSLTRLIKDYVHYSSHNFYEISLSGDPIISMFFSKNKYQSIANIVNSSNLKSYVFLRTGYGIQGKFIAQRVQNISNVEFYQTGLEPSKNPDLSSPYIYPHNLPNLIKAKSDIPLDYARTVLQEVGLYKVETPFIF